MPCPHCRNPNRYTDPLGNIRCIGCFNHVPGTPAPTIGVLQDLDAPMTFSHYFAPREPIHHGR